MDIPDIITIIGRTISQPFLFLTFLYYRRTIDLRYLYRMCFMNYLVSLVISNFWNIWAIINGYHKERPNHIFHIYNFIELSLLLWTNVLCFNFWQNIKNLILSSDDGEERITFIKCFLYVWLCSLLYTIVNVINDYLFESQSSIHQTVTWISFLFPVFILVSNSSMIIHATVIIIKEIRAISIYLSGPNTIRNNDNRKKKLLILYCKLFVVTIFVICSKWFWFRLNNIWNIRAFYLIFEFLMVVNSFQGIFIYFLFAFKKKNLIAFKIKISKLLNSQTTQCELNTPETPANKGNSFDGVEQLKNSNALSINKDAEKKLTYVL